MYYGKQIEPKQLNKKTIENPEDKPLTINTFCESSFAVQAQ